jgi:hypothetical protein
MLDTSWLPLVMPIAFDAWCGQAVLIYFFVYLLGPAGPAR